MSDSLRDQLLGLGFKPAPKPERPARADGAASGQGRHGHGKPPHARQGEGRAAQGQRQQPGARPADAGQRRQGEGKQGHGKPQDGSAHDGRAHESRRRPQRDAQARPGRPRTQEEIDLAKAYALRAEREKQERIEAERVRQEEARLRREAKAKLAELVKDKALNDKDAEIARHFEYGGKIKRIYVNADQLRRLNAGELGVLQLDGRYLLVEAALLAEAETVFAPAVALKVDPDAPAGDDPYADPQYQVPDDLVW